MKILHVIPSFELGGIEKFVTELSIQQSFKNKVYILALGQSNNNIYQNLQREYLKGKNIDVFILDKRVGKDKLKILKKCRGYVKKINPDIINSHSEETTFHLINSIIGLRKNVFETIHSKGCSYPILQKYYLQFFLNKIVAISNSTKNSLIYKAKIKERKIELIHNGINRSKFLFKNRVINYEIKNIISIGRLSPEKNHSMLIRGFKLYKNKLESLGMNIPKLCIVGDGNELHKLKEIISNLGLEDEIKLLGERNDINEILKKADIYVLPSTEEGLSISLIEALSSGVPIVATDVGGNSDIIQNYKTGLLIESGNFYELSKKMFEYTINYKLRKNISINSIKKSVYFDIKFCEKKYFSMYSKERK